MADTMEPMKTRDTAVPVSSESRADWEARRRVEAAKRIQASHDKAVALGIIDASGKRIRKLLPTDMTPGLDRDFGG